MPSLAPVRPRAIAAVLLPSMILAATVAVPAGAAPTELFLSEYVEGSSNKKALEIYNGTATAVDLAGGGYRVQMHFNGNVAPGLTVNLTGTVAPGGVFVLANAAASPAILAVADQTGGGGWFNGDDAVVLLRGSVVVDSIGQVGADPGTEWGTGLTSTADNTLRRNASVEGGDTDPTDAFDPAATWTGAAVDNLDDLGRHGATSPPPPPSRCSMAADTEIADVQGRGTASPLVGRTVRVEGVVTGDFQGGTGLGGFFVQDPTPDGDPQTSDGIFVFASTPAVATGDLVRVTGAVVEFNGLTEISPATVVDICGQAPGPLPATVSLPDPAGLERHESVLVSLPQTLTVTETFQLGRFGEVVVSAGGRLFNPTNGNDPAATPAANATRRLTIDDASGVQNPPVIPFSSPSGTPRIGDTLTGATGVLSFGFGNYRLQPTAPLALSVANPRPATPDPVGGDIQVASFNVLNYFTDFGCPTCRGANSAADFDRQRRKTIAAIAALDAEVVGLVEMQNNGDAAVADLVAGLNAATSPGNFASIVGPAPGTDAIQVALLYRPVAVVPDGVALSDTDPVHNRAPVAQVFRPAGGGRRFAVVVSHFKSKGSCPAGATDPEADRGQGCWNALRTRQAGALTTFAASLPTNDVLLMGDLNAYAEEDPVHALEAAGFTSVEERLAPADRYSYVFDGQAGSLDHALASRGLARLVTGADIWHINADEPLFRDYNTEFNPPAYYEPGPYRSSDHDPVLVGLELRGGVADEEDRSGAGTTLAVIGDTPYGEAQLAEFPSLVDAINRDPKIRTVVHVGDIKNGSSLCTDSYFDTIAQQFARFRDPLVYTPGDNEWTDCHRANNGGYNPVERLAAVRSTFFPDPGRTLGRRPMKVHSQAAAPAFAPFVENVAWTESQVRLASVHVVGSNNGLAPWFGGAETPAQREQRLAENAARTAAALDWIDETFDRAGLDRSVGVVLAMQADTFRGGSVVAGFESIVGRIATRAADFGRPVLLVQGDSHRFLVDRPIPTAPNVTRVVVEGETADEWLEVTIDPRSTDVFSLERRTPATSGDALVIGHRGASGYRPEHTLAAYELAIDQCADFIEPDLVVTADGVLVARHENEIGGTTDVASHPEFAARRTTKVIDGVTTTGWFTEDFTLAELKTLRASERIPGIRPANTAFDGLFEVPTFHEVIDLAQSRRTCDGRPVGIYPETKHPSYFAGLGLPLERRLVDLLDTHGLSGPNDPAFIQSFEVQNLRDLRRITKLPLVQLINCTGQPWDFTVSGDTRTFADLVTPAGLDFVAGYARGIGACKNVLIPRDGAGNLAAPSPVIADAHARKLVVHGWTFRLENQFLPTSLRSSADPNAPGDMAAEVRIFVAAGMDGFFTDHPDVGVTAAG